MRKRRHRGISQEFPGDREERPHLHGKNARRSASALISTTKALSEFYRERRYHLRRWTPTVPSSRPGTRSTRTCTRCCSSRRKGQHAPSSAALQAKHSTRAQGTDSARGPPFAKRLAVVRGKRLRAEHAKTNSARMSPGQDPDEFLYELDPRRERLNVCDPPEGPTGRQLEDSILQARPPECERIGTSQIAKPDFGIADIRRMISAINAANLARSSSTTGTAGRGAAIPAAKDNSRDMTYPTTNARGISRRRVPSTSSTSSIDHNESNGTNTRTSSRADSVNEADSVAVKRHASRQATEGGGVSTTTLLTTATPTAAPKKLQRPRSRRSTHPHAENLQRARHPRLQGRSKMSVHLLLQD